MKAEELRKLSEGELLERLRELRAELAKLRAKAVRGTIAKESGKVRAVRRDLSRILTVLGERSPK